MAAKAKTGKCDDMADCEREAGHEGMCTHEDGDAEPAPAVKTRKKPERAPLPTDPTKWTATHSLLVLGRIERAFGLVPVKRRAAFRQLVAESLGQVDIEETAVKS
jgi:hypothetical protein